MCVPTLWWTYTDTPDSLDDIGKCYAHFEEPDFEDDEDFSWISIGLPIQIVVGLLVFGICAGAKLLQGKKLEQAQNINAAAFPPNVGDIPTVTDSTYPQITNFPNGPGNAPGTTMNQQFGQWGYVTQMQTPPGTAQQQAFSQPPPTIPAPSYEESFQYGNSR